MPRKRRLLIIAKERPFDEEQWKQLLTAFTYVLHERRQAREAVEENAADPADTTAAPEASDDR